jgi:hypothetical protein
MLHQRHFKASQFSTDQRHGLALYLLCVREAGTTTGCTRFSSLITFHARLLLLLLLLLLSPLLLLAMI